MTVASPIINKRAQYDREKVDALAREVLQFSRDILSVKMRFLNPALSRLEPVSSDWHLATDGVRLLYDPPYVVHTYVREKNRITRNYLHLTLHCVFQHFYVDLRINQMLWNISCDMAVENLITEMNLECTRVEREARQQEVLAPIRKAIGQLTAEKIYHYLLRNRPKEDTLIHWWKLFMADDHESWYISSISDEIDEMGDHNSDVAGDSDKTGNTSASNENSENADRLSEQKRQIRDQWEQVSQQIQIDLETFSKKMGDSARGLMQNLQEVNREKYDYASFLKKFASIGEVMQVNDDEFDYIFYTYGLNLYENIPLIEPLEYKDVKRIKEFVIAIDTSGSVSGELVQQFVQKTYNILMQQENFFSKINLHIIQCDSVIHEDAKITSKEEFERYLANMTLRGTGGTDFRPVFKRVDEMIRDKEFTNLKGMIYFTDGEGTFPERQPGYQTAFVFVKDDYKEPQVPAWAIKLVLRNYELEQSGTEMQTKENNINNENR